MFNKPRDTNFNPNDNSRRNIAIVRWIMWTFLVHPVGIITAIFTLYITMKLGFRARWIFTLPPLALIIEAVLFRAQQGPRPLVMWANAFRFRRDWFGIWTDTVTARTDHANRVFGLAPLLGFIPHFDGSIISWTLRPPKGQTMEYYSQFTDVIATHSYAVKQVHVIYDGPTSEKGKLRAVFPQPQTITSVVDTLKEDLNEFA